MERKDVQEKYRWKLEDIFATDEDWEKAYEQADARISEYAEFKGKLKNKAKLKAAYAHAQGIGELIEKIFCYASMRHDENAADTKYAGYYDRAYSLATREMAESSFFSSELSALDEKVLGEFISDPELKDFDYLLSEIRRQKAHILSDKEEKILALSSESAAGFKNVFSMINNVDLPMPEIDDGTGNKVRLTHGNYSAFLASKDGELRKRAFDGMYGAFSSLIHAIAACYTGNVKKNNFYTRVRGFDSTLERALYGDDIPASVYDGLIENVHAALPAVHDYVRYRKKALGGEQHMYDLYVSVIDGVKEIELDYEDAFKIVLKGLKPLGEEYLGLLQRAHDERWIDVYETTAKRSGAYMSAVYGVHPFVLLNHTKTTHAVFTIAHELGHAMHSYYSEKTQPYFKADYAIFVAEVASTVNEVLLLKHLVATTKDAGLKKYLLTYYLDMMRTTLFRQTMFAEFEKKAHDADMQGVPLTPEYLNGIYYDLNKQYYGDGVVHDDAIKYEWARIPHFYTAFYVYKYATGITSAVSIANAILSNKKNAKESYKKFLSAGGSDSPYKILKIAGVDLADKAPYEAVMKEFSDTLKELESLG